MKNGDSPAFAIDPELAACGISKEYQGLTKREYFAAMAMQSLLTGITTTVNNASQNIYSASRPKIETIELTVPELAKKSIIIANELLKQLEPC